MTCVEFWSHPNLGELFRIPGVAPAWRKAAHPGYLRSLARTIDRDADNEITDKAIIELVAQYMESEEAGQGVDSR